MIANFETIMNAIYTLEGGFTNDPRDPGGMTNLGVTAREWAAYLGIPLSGVSENMMQGLTRESVNSLYRINYWNIIDGDMLPSGIDAMLMHMEVNAGGVAGKELQRIVGANPIDGLIGTKTLGSITLYVQYAGVIKLIDTVATAQLTYYATLPGFAVYGRGWSNRVTAMKKLAYSL